VLRCLSKREGRRSYDAIYMWQCVCHVLQKVVIPGKRELANSYHHS
jgi:hypothetical protein